jgi:hypothetical protein
MSERQVVDDAAVLHDDRGRREQVGVEAWRLDERQDLRPREERKHPFKRFVDPPLSAECAKGSLRGQQTLDGGH